MLPMYQAEAMWMDFTSSMIRRHATYPFLIKIAAGKINAVTGDQWVDPPQAHPQDYVVVPEQPWLDGFCVKKGVIRQFVAMPLGSGYSAEEQITGEADHGGVQILACPMKRDVFERRFPEEPDLDDDMTFRLYDSAPASAEMGLAPGGQMRQEIFDDPFDFNDWDFDHISRCFVHISNSMVWEQATGAKPPTTPPTAKHYTKAGLPWFDYYSENPAVDGSVVLNDLKSVATMGQQKGEVPLPENQSVDPHNIVKLRDGLRPGQVREARF